MCSKWINGLSLYCVRAGNPSRNDWPELEVVQHPPLQLLPKYFDLSFHPTSSLSGNTISSTPTPTPNGSRIRLLLSPSAATTPDQPVAIPHLDTAELPNPSSSCLPHRRQGHIFKCNPRSGRSVFHYALNREQTPQQRLTRLYSRHTGLFFCPSYM